PCASPKPDRFRRRPYRVLLPQHAGRNHIEDGGGMFHLLAKGPHSFESAAGGCEVELACGHRLSQRDDLPFDIGQIPIEDLADTGRRRLGRGSIAVTEHCDQREEDPFYNTLLKKAEKHFHNDSPISPVLRRVETLANMSRGKHARTPAGFLLCASYISKKLRANSDHRSVAGHRNRRQFSHLQRSQCATPAAAAVSRSRSPGDPLAPFSRYQHSARLALARPVHRHSSGEPLLRRDVHFAGPERDSGGARSTRAGRSASNL